MKATSSGSGILVLNNFASLTKPTISVQDSDLSIIDDLDNTKARPMGILTGIVVLSVTAGSLIASFGDDKLAFNTPNSVQAVSDSIFSTYLIPFEVVSVMLLAALIGAIVLARKD